MYKLKNIYTKTSLIVCILLAAISCMGFVKQVDVDKNKIHKNIYIENKQMGGLTQSEAKKLLKEYFKEEALVIKYKDNTWNINPQDINLCYNIDDAVEKAYEYTHTDDKTTNIKRSINLMYKGSYRVNIISGYNEIKLHNKLNEICQEVNIKVKDAHIEIKDSGELIRTESKDGLEVDIINLKEQIYDMITSQNINIIELPTITIKPILTTEDVMSVNSILGQYSTSFNEYSARGSNIHVAANSTSEIIIMPQDSFSYNNTTGYRSWSNGYKTAKVIVGGKYVNGEGGGVCQVSTTIYNAALLAGMNIEEVHNHTIQSHYAPRGRDAAVSYGYTDLKFKNEYSHPVYIKNIVKNGVITTKIYGCKSDKEKIYVRTEEKYSKEKIYVKTYRVYLDEENNKIRDELISNNIYKKY